MRQGFRAAGAAVLAVAMVVLIQSAPAEAQNRALMGGAFGAAIGGAVGGGKGAGIGAATGMFVGHMREQREREARAERERWEAEQRHQQQLQQQQLQMQQQQQQQQLQMQQQQQAQQQYQQPAGQVRAQNCRPYQTNQVVDGRTVTMTGTACQQPDGSWILIN